MRIPCPYCGPRSHEEFTYLGDATLRRPPVPPSPPAPEHERSAGTLATTPPDPALLQAFCDFVYLRDNSAGWHQELWFHGAGCHLWLVVERDTCTHEIRSARPACDSAAVQGCAARTTP